VYIFHPVLAIYALLLHVVCPVVVVRASNNNDEIPYTSKGGIIRCSTSQREGNAMKWY